MTNGISTLCAAIASFLVACLIVRLVGQFVAGHTLRVNRWLRDRSRSH
ncbi:hypothetical protein SAMN05444166_0298 [Singulisphaera sp. GP187]|nr:hypothetical protein [Singulisphaera sp. GP187]SIN70837.1 hypothetical protein SAMN05444166_0298 [Singulisphaera sp. GP187]